MTPYLLVIGDREALGWILTARRMAFPDGHRSEVRSLKKRDQLFIYATRAAFKNPTRDRGRVIGTASVRSAVTPLERPVCFGDREYLVGCDLGIGPLTAFGTGVELAPLARDLETFVGVGEAWSIMLRRPLLRLTQQDANRISRELQKILAEQDPDTDPFTAYSRWYLATHSLSRGRHRQLTPSVSVRDGEST
jgi:hypothetical protein